jgi:hypothetical protein
MPKEIRRFTPLGEREFAGLFIEPTSEVMAEFASRLFDPEISTVVFDAVEIPDAPKSRFELAEALFLCQSDTKKLNIKDKQLWNWLGAYFMCTQIMKSGDNSHVGDSKRWLVSESSRYFYRHLLLGPFMAYSAHSEKPEAALCMLAQPLLTPGELVEQIQSTSEIAYSVCASVATRLYVDLETGLIKKGAGGKGLGSARRLTASYLNQIRVNLDIRGMTEAELLSILPAEFDRFKDEGFANPMTSSSTSSKGIFDRLRKQLGMN